MRIDPDIPILLIAALALAASIFVAVRARPPRATAIRRVLIALLLVGVGLRPVVGSVPVTGAALPVDVVILVDRTNSMAAEDWNGDQPRMAGVAADAPELLQVITGANVTLITFDSVARTEMPFVTDASAVGSMLETIGFQHSLYGTGSDIGLAVPLATQVLTKAKQQAPNRTRYLIYIGDGEQTLDDPPTSFAPLQPLLTGALVLGYGTEQGAKMKTGVGSEGHTADSSGNDAISKLDEANLRAIADQLGGNYLHRTKPGPIDYTIKFGAAEAAGEARFTGGLEIYWIAGLGIAALMAWELWVLMPKIRRARQELS